jgi:hypothetical protein
MATEQRKTIWVNPLQTKFTVRVGIYLLTFLGALVSFTFAWRLWEEGLNDPVEQFVRMLRDYTPVVICVVWLLPLIAWDTFRQGHRLLGPIPRIRRTLQAVAHGELVRPIKLREGDHLTELCDDVNTMLDALQRRGVPILRPADPAREEAAQRKPA